MQKGQNVPSNLWNSFSFVKTWNKVVFMLIKGITKGTQRKNFSFQLALVCQQQQSDKNGVMAIAMVTSMAMTFFLNFQNARKITKRSNITAHLL